MKTDRLILTQFHSLSTRSFNAHQAVYRELAVIKILEITEIPGNGILLDWRCNQHCIAKEMH
jgi:hypothetical protein